MYVKNAGQKKKKGWAIKFKHWSDPQLLDPEGTR